MSKEVFFFATKSDITSGLQAIEDIRPVKYVKTGLFDDRDVPVYMSYNEIQYLGINSTGNHQSESYLVLDKSVGIIVREVPQSKGGVKYAVDQMHNNASIVFWPGGLYMGDYLVCGHIETISNDLISQELFKEFSKKITKGFKKIGRHYCGPDSLQLKGRVRFITMSINQSSEYDLKVD